MSGTYWWCSRSWDRLTTNKNLWHQREVCLKCWVLCGRRHKHSMGTQMHSRLYAAGIPRQFRPPGWRFSGREHTIPILRESNEVEEIRLPPSQSALPSSGLLGLAHWIVNICACAPPYSGAPTIWQRLSPLKNQRDEEQRQPGTMRSRLPRTACLLRLFALCILLAHSAAYFGSADFLIT